MCIVDVWPLCGVRQEEERVVGKVLQPLRIVMTGLRACSRSGDKQMGFKKKNNNKGSKTDRTW